MNENNFKIMKNGTLIECNVESAVVRIPDNVIRIGKECFKRSKLLKKVILPVQLIEIDKRSFYDCTNLECVDFNNSQPKKIGENAFGKCTNLKEIVLPESITAIGYSCFQYSGLQEITLSNLRVVPDYAFYYCENLKHIYNTRCIETIGDFAFDSTLLSGKLDFPAVKTIGEKAFAYTEIREISLPSIKEIGKRCFGNCKYLTHVFLASHSNQGITARKCCFASCKSLIEVHGSEYILKLEEDTFSGCSALQKYVCAPEITVIPKFCFSDCTALEAVSFSPNLERIEARAFACCSQLSSADFAKTKLKSIEYYAFEKCSLQEINFPPSLTYLENGVFSNCQSLEVISFLGNNITIEKNCFFACSELFDVYFPNAKIEISNFAFEGTKIYHDGLYKYLDGYGS